MIWEDFIARPETNAVSVQFQTLLEWPAWHGTHVRHTSKSDVACSSYSEMHYFIQSIGGVGNNRPIYIALVVYVN